MPRPWFERWGGIGYRPINAKGRLVLGAMGFLFFGFGILSLLYQDIDSVIATALALLAAGTAIVGHIIIVSHMREF